MTATSEDGLQTQEAGAIEPSKVDQDRSRTVFVVHGRNEPARKALYIFLRSIGLAPVEWSQALAMTGQASPYIGDVLDAALKTAQAVVVLLTPDEITSLRSEYADGEDDPEVKPAAQSRPNVLFEAGLALGRAPDRTVIAELGTVRRFSDIAGRHIVRLSNSVASRQQLALRLRTAGCSVDLTGEDWHSAGDFSAPPPLRVPAGSSQPASFPQPNRSVPLQARSEISNLITLANIAVMDTGRRGRYEIHGEAINSDNIEHSASVRATFYDAERKIVGAGHGFVSQLAAGQTKAFSFKSDGDVTGYASMNVQVDHIYNRRR
jgi:predicted nucleotide-binding protein